MADDHLEEALRATFAAHAGTITAGPVWDESTAATGIGAASSLSSGAAAVQHGDRPVRWRAPLLAAAAVVLIATSVAVAAHRNGTHPASPAVSGTGDGVTTAGGFNDSADLTVRVDSAGSITVARGTPATTIDIYEDALCPICAEFEHANGAEIAAQVDAGTIAVRYRMVDFLDPGSASGTYSTRAHAALITVATDDGDEPGVFMRFRAALFSAANQPHEAGATDLSDADLARLAADAGASPATQRAIGDGTSVPAAKAAAASNLAELTKVAAEKGRAPGVPTVAVGDTSVDTQQADWLTDLLRRPAGTPGN